MVRFRLRADLTRWGRVWVGRSGIQHHHHHHHHLFYLKCLQTIELTLIAYTKMNVKISKYINIITL